MIDHQRVGAGFGDHRQDLPGAATLVTDELPQPGVAIEVVDSWGRIARVFFPEPAQPELRGLGESLRDWLAVCGGHDAQRVDGPAENSSSAQNAVDRAIAEVNPS